MQGAANDGTHGAASRMFLELKSTQPLHQQRVRQNEGGVHNTFVVLPIE